MLHQTLSNEFAALSPLKQAVRFREMTAAASPRRELTTAPVSQSAIAASWAKVMAEVQGRDVTADPSRFGTAKPWKEIMRSL